MTRISPLLAALAVVVALPAAPAQALIAKTWVSRTGSDAAACTLAAPCATLQHAHDLTSSGGEIGVLNASDYLPLTITKSVHITNDSAGEAAITAPGGPTVVINGAVGDIVSLRGLVIDGEGAGTLGIIFNSGLALHVQNCVIKNFNAASAFGLLFEPTGNSQLFVSDTIVINNGSNAVSGGIEILPSGSGSANVVLDRVHLENNVDGLRIDGTLASAGNGAHVVVRESVMSGNAANGIRAVTAAGKPPAFAIVERSSMVNNLANGILADGPGATLLLKDSTVSRNNVGISTVNSGQLISYRNNRINNNIGPDGTPTSLRTLR